MSKSLIIRKDVLTQIIDTVRAADDECKIHFDEDQLRISVVDPANIAMVNVRLDTAAFESYNFDGQTVGVDLTRLDDMVGMVDEEIVQLSFNAETRMLDIESGTLKHELALIDPDLIRQEPDLPDIEDKLTTSVAIEGRHIKRATKACGLTSDQIDLDSNPDRDQQLHFIAEGDMDTTRVRFGADEILAGSVGETGHTLLSLEYLSELTKPMPKGTDIRLRHGEEFPVIFEYSFADSNGKVVNVIAPRIQSD